MAGGEGTRLYPLTSETPKPLIKIKNRPMIDYVIASLQRIGIYDIYIAIT